MNKGQITLSVVAGVFGSIAVIGAPFLYVSNLRADGIEVDAKMNTAIIVNTTNIENLEEKIDDIKDGIDDIKMYLNVK